MRYSFNEKLFNLLEVMKCNDSINIDVLSHKLLISRRNVYYFIEELNKELDRKKIPRVVNQSKKGISFSCEQLNFFQSLINVEDEITLSHQQRVARIYCEIFSSSKEIKFLDLQTSLDYSKTVITNDLCELRRKIKTFKLKIVSTSKGYVVVGNKIDQRRAFLYFYSLLIPLLNRLSLNTNYHNVNSINIYRSLKQFEHTTNLCYHDNTLLGLAALLCVNKNNLSIDEYNEQKIHEIEYQYIRGIYADLSDNEAAYFANILSCSRVSEYGCDLENVKELVEEMITCLHMITGIHITDELLIEKLYQHIGQSSIRFKYGIIVDNSLVEEVKERYEASFQAVRVACQAVEKKYKTLITDSEIAFITLYVAGYLKQRSKSTQSIQVLLICDKGSSVVYAIKSEIEALQNNISVECRDKYEDSIDFRGYQCIVSTMELDKRLDSIRVHSILTCDDRFRIMTKIKSELLENFISIEEVIKVITPYVEQKKLELISTELKQFSIRKQVEENNKFVFLPKYCIELDSSRHQNWKEIIWRVASPLLNDFYIKEEYVQEIVNNIEEYGPYMVYNNGYLLGHAQINHSNRLGLSVAHLTEPICIQDVYVNKVMLVSLVDYSSHLTLIQRLHQMFEDDEFNQRLNEVDDKYYEFSNYLFSST